MFASKFAKNTHNKNFGALFFHNKYIKKAKAIAMSGYMIPHAKPNTQSGGAKNGLVILE